MDDIEKQSQWVDIIAIVLSAIGSLAAIAGAVLVGLSQIQATGVSIWPLPGLVLIDWLLLGAGGILGAFLVIRPTGTKWIQAIWVDLGAFVPLIILSALFIGPYVLITYVLYLISAIILSVRRHPNWLVCFRSFMLGLLVNLAILVIMIYLGNPAR